MELIARIRLALRHRLKQQGNGRSSRPATLRSISCGGSSASATARSNCRCAKYDILRVLVQHAGKVLTHHFLIRQVWGGVADVQNLRVHVRQLRQKIDDNTWSSRLISGRKQVWATACVWPTGKRTKGLNREGPALGPRAGGAGDPKNLLAPSSGLTRGSQAERAPLSARDP